MVINNQTEVVNRFVEQIWPHQTQHNGSDETWANGPLRYAEANFHSMMHVCRSEGFRVLWQIQVVLKSEVIQATSESFKSQHGGWQCSRGPLESQI